MSWRGRAPGDGEGGPAAGARPVFAVTDDCAGCGACIPTCPEQAFLPGRTEGRVPLVILADRCTGCAECAEVCPVAAIIEVREERQ